MAGYGSFNFSSPPPPPDYNTNTPPPPSSASASASSSSSSASTSASAPTSSNTKLVAGIGVGIGIPVLLIAVAFFVIWFKRKRRHALLASSDTLPKSQQQYWQQNASPPTPETITLLVQKPESVDSSFGPAGQQYWQQNASRSTRDTSPMLQRPVSVASGFGSKTTFTYEELAKATNDFSESNFLGQGSFGCVYKGVLPKGKEVAIKKLKFGNQQGVHEFQAEIETISRIHHNHLVFLAGYCISGTHRLLVYQFVPNKTLKFHLHDKDKDSPSLKWEMRMKIALGSAKGLTYLHEDCDPKIIHRDIKSANILLDYSFEAKVADFGLARFNSDTHLHTTAAGTKGYIAPECINGKITEKSDVYSFGVVLLELITGRQPTGEEAQHIVDWAKPLLTKALKDKFFDNLADPRLQKYNSDEMARMVTCAAACVSHSAQDRPRMSEIVQALEVNVSLADLSEGIRPGHITIYESPDDFKEEEDSKILRNMAPGSYEHGANGDSVTNPSASANVDSVTNPSASASQPTRDTIPLMVEIPASVDSSFGRAGQQYWQQNASRSTPDTSPMLQGQVSVGSGFDSKTIFTYEELEKATNGFSDANFLGKGGFGDVYKGVLVPKGKEVAIKKLKPGSDQGDREFRTEIETISRIHHKHLVSLEGYCIYETQRLLVYQFLPNKTLKFHLHDNNDGPTLRWGMRMKIALGAAKGLTYLHEDRHPKIIHRDIKSANILLDDSFEATVADFGLARFNSDTKTHVSTAAAGTRGYIAPECINGKINEKSDVYSFGVVLLELITGKPTCEVQPTGEAQYIVDWAEPLLTKALKDNNFDTLADPRLQKDYNPVEMARMVTCAATCVRHSPQDRPRMSKIVQALEVNVSLADLSEGIRPGHSTIYESPDDVKEEEDSKILRNMAPGSHEHGANGDSVTNPSASANGDTVTNPSASDFF